MKISTKIYVTFSGVLGMVLLLGGYVLLRIDTLGALQDKGAQSTTQALAVKDIRNRLGDVYTVVADAQINRRIDHTRAEWARMKTLADQDMQTLRSILSQPEDAETLRRFFTEYAQYLAFFEQKMLSLLEKMLAQKATTSEDEQQLRRLDDEIDGLRDKAQAVLDTINQSLTRKAAAAHQDFGAVRKSMAYVLCGMFLVIAIFIGVIAAVLVGKMTKPLADAQIIAQKIAEGDLTVHIPATEKDEVGQLLGTMAAMSQQLQQIVGEVYKTVGRVNNASDRIARGNTELSQRTEAQATALEQTAASMARITATVRQSAQNTQHATQLASSTRQQAEEGGVAVEKTIVAMHDIQESSEKIASITGVVDEIAFQTNLLALNAAVEAARAGEQGRSFAIVAAEVRKLAQRSADAAKEIKALTDESMQRVKSGEVSVAQSAQLLREIVEAVRKVNQLVSEMAAASHEQASNIEQASKAVMEMDQSTQRNSALVQQTAAASQSMHQQADKLRTLMEFFRLDVDTRAFFEDDQEEADTGQLITWSDSLSVVHPEMDRQHRQLVDLINQLNAAMCEGSTREVMGAIFNRLIEYTAKHFAAEEALITACHYPQLTEHKKRHADLVKKVLAFQEQFQNGSGHINMQLMRFLKDWITNHIQKSDKHYVPYVMGKMDRD